MKKKLTDNLGLKILALLFSVVLWLIVVNINDPQIPAYFYGIPVEIINADSIISQGKVFEVLDDTDTIDVVVRAKRSVADSLVKDNIRAVADMKELTFMDTVGIKLSSNKNNLDSITSTTESLKLNIENMQRANKVISSVAVGEPADGYVLGTIATDQNMVALSGPESAISQVEKVVASVNVEGMSSDISTKVNLKLYDADNKLIENKNIVKNIDSVNVNVEILARATVPVHFTTVGIPATGYILSGNVVSKPEYVEIAGKKSVIDGVKAIEIPEINITGQSADLIENINIKEYLPDGVSYVGENSTVTVTAKIVKEVTRTFMIPKKNISLVNAPVDKIAALSVLADTLTETIKVDISGLAEVINTLNVDSITGVVDINSLEELLGVESIKDGTYSGEIEFQLPDGARVAATVSTEVVISAGVVAE